MYQGRRELYFYKPTNLRTAAISDNQGVVLGDNLPKFYLSEADFAVYFSRLSLQAVGVWPDLNGSRSYSILSDIVFIISSLLTGYFIVVAQTTKLFLIGGDLDTIVDILCTADIPVLVALIKMMTLRYDSKGANIMELKFPKLFDQRL